ncbi:vacuolar protein sorting-associated protein 9A-like [Hordeum vulgare]|nr:vacuolar protein sorting-associated protein 9A-like [Hordeum vulgare]
MLCEKGRSSYGFASSAGKRASMEDFYETRVDDVDGETVGQAAAKTNDLAGDGTTTFVILAQGMIAEGVKGLEKYIMTKLFDRTFASSPEDAAADGEVSDKIGLLQRFVRPHHLDIPKLLNNEASWLEIKDMKVKADAITRLMERGYKVKCMAMPAGNEAEDLGGPLSRLLGLVRTPFCTMEHLKRIAEEMQKQVAVVGAI